jgi:hypothetical protein
MLISVKTTVKYQLERGQESMGDAPVLSRFFLLRNLDQNQSVIWSIVMKEKTFFLTASKRRRKMSIYISLFRVTIPANYTSECL